MSTKHNTKHNRKPSNYKLRLKKRGLTVSPRLRTLYELRNQAGVKLNGNLITKQDLDEVRRLGQ